MSGQQQRRRGDVRYGDGYITERQRKDGSTVYQARWKEPQPDGKDVWRSKSFDDEDGAEDHLRTIGRSKRKGKYTPESRITVTEAVTEYLERGHKRWSAVTYAGYKQIARAHIESRIGNVVLTELTPSQVQRWIGELSASGLHPSTVHSCRLVLNGACREAVVLGVLANNPVTPTRSPKRKRVNIVTWDSDHVAAVMRQAAPSVMMHAYYAVALTTGMRPGEIRALKWEDVDMEERVIHCLRTMTRDENNATIIGEVTKTKRARTIALPASTIKALQSLKADQNKRRLAAERWNNIDIIFDRGDGNPMYQKTVARLHNAICELAGVPTVRLHDLRHTAATLMLRNGVNLKIVSEILGHASIATTADIYGHVDIAMQRSATDALGDLVTVRDA